MKQRKMKYKGFEFPCNPARVQIKSSRTVSETALINSGGSADDICANPREVFGEGRFFGEGALEASSHLEAMCKTEGAGWLYLPSGECMTAILKELTISQDANKNEVSYSFKFIETRGAKETVYRPKSTAVREGENLFDVAHRCGVPIEKLISLNDFKTPFDVSAGEGVALR